MVTDDQIIAAYKKHEQLFAAAKELDMPWQTMYWRLKRAGIEVNGNKARWGSARDKFGARGEMLFKELVPFAEDQNAGAFQSKVDFIVNGFSVDVKCAKRKRSSSRFQSKRWAFSLKKQIETADFYVCMAYDEAGDQLQAVYLLPRDLIGAMHTVSIPCSGKSKWSNYRVDHQGLSSFFGEMSQSACPSR